MIQLKLPIDAIILIAVVLTFGDFGGEATSFSSGPKDATIVKNARWMSRVSDDLALSQLSLPGTHDTCALYDGLSLGFAKCQTWRPEDQLKSGIRFIDIRCRHVGDQFLIYHGIIDQKMTFQTLRDICRDFLKQHPTECIVMSVKEESTAKGNSRSFAETFFASVKNDGDLWHIKSSVPKLRSVRGRIVLVDRVGTLGGIQWADLAIQDHYNVPIDARQKLILSHLEKARDSQDFQWFIHFCSGNVPANLMTPKKYAVQSNEVALGFLRTHQPDEIMRLGTFVMDFPGDELINRIIGSNFSSRQIK